MKLLKIDKKQPDHKQLCLVDCGVGILLPAIYYNNNSFKGFWKYTSYYEVYNKFYCEVPLSPDDQIINVKKWLLIPKI